MATPEVSGDHRAAIATLRPAFADLPMVPRTAGWDSDAVDVGGMIYKFPKTPGAATRLRKEARLLALIRPRVPLPVPDMSLIETPMLFSEHKKIPGEMIETPQYEVLSLDQRTAMAEKLARFYADLHAIPLADATAAGAVTYPGWPPAAELLALADVKLPPSLHDFARRALSAYEAMSSHDQVLGYFDGHGWNMAFDHAAGVLNGVYDFADAGLGPLNKDLGLSSFISPDLTERLTDAYERQTGRHIDRREVALHTAAQRLAELDMSTADDDAFVDRVIAWHDYMQSRPELRLD